MADSEPTKEKKPVFVYGRTADRRQARQAAHRARDHLMGGRARLRIARLCSMTSSAASDARADRMGTGAPTDCARITRRRRSAPTPLASSTCATHWKTTCTSPTSPPDASTSTTLRTSAACRSPRKTTRTWRPLTGDKVLHGDDVQHYPNVMQCRVRMPIDGDLQNPATSSPRSRTTPRL